jgi:asparagine N-glycosylation enzyme membrane subunit Stt3
MSGWIKLHRQILEWEWYSDNNCFRLFTHLVLKANYKQKRFKGIELKKGSIVTSRDILARETGLSSQQIRTALNKLISTNEVTSVTSSQGTIIQIVNYEKYQVETNEITNEQPTDNQRVTTNNKVKKENKEINTFEASLFEYGFNPELIKQWLIIRKQKKSVNSEIAFKGFIREVEKSHLTKDEILQLCIEKSWKGFEASWVEKPKQQITEIDFNQIPNKFPWA